MFRPCTRPQPHLVVHGLELCRICARLMQLGIKLLLLLNGVQVALQCGGIYRGRQCGWVRCEAFKSHILFQSC